MKKIFLGLFLMPLFCIAQIPVYYASIDFSQSGESLRSDLTNLVSTTHVYDLVYTPEVWNALKQTDLDPTDNTKVLLVYGYEDGSDDVYFNDRRRDKDLSCHTSSCTGLWVREHTFPRSLGNPNLGYVFAGSDAHHLRAIDSQFNNTRSNRIFDEGSGNATVLENGNFYPGDEWKGDVARMMMYMYLRYTSQCPATVVGAGTASNPFSDMPDIFLNWNAQDPVSDFEINRNNILQTLQGNRNPFIDNPYLATMIWGGMTATDSWNVLSNPKNEVETILLYPTVTSGTLHLKNLEGTIGYSIYNSIGQLVQSGKTERQIDFQSKSTGIYFVTLSNESFSKTFKVLLQ
ncbi:endonuclease I [Flavobacterium arsenatis]|uniref:Endonuclease I n=1 Tax=Flavobacterium arsenatis TaxID=1484332 RepID=A0ABU1TSL7_9FLAO|nr:endonuclease [Flavobacterium arsenatis]MDR6968832.1 endonuclease I [Flavobacterium arsenatis]